MIGRSLSHYRITEKLGAGGMGEVYRAEDTNLNRQVAIKVLPDVFAGDPERLARFEREAKLLASLNHPNIAAIHGLEEADGKRFLVLELVEGQTLAERLHKGPLPFEEALDVCRQIAAGLEAAHEKGIIHRDLKPANVKLMPEGNVKVLDFGLAKALADEIQTADASHSPTITEAMTRPGVVLGTAAYMSPEQAKGKPVDKRADVWAFGCVLYECLTGRRAFEGETITETLASILKGEPNWQAVPVNTPATVQDLLHLCLVKDPRERLHDIGDARLEISEALGRAEAREPLRQRAAYRRSLMVGSGLAILIAGAILGIVADRSLRRTPPAPVLRALAPLPTGIQLTRDRQGPVRTELAISPDGSFLVFSASPDGSEGKARLYRRAMDRSEATPVADTDGARMPFFSPNGRWIGFWAKGKLLKIAADGGIPNPICSLSSIPFGASWGLDDRVVFGTGVGLQRVSAGGGTPETLAAANPGTESTIRLPHVLPNGRALLFTAMPHAWGVEARVEALSLESGQRKILVEYAADARYMASGHLVFLRNGSLMAAPFDPDRIEITGPSVSVVSGIMQALNESNSAFNSAAGSFAVSQSGALAYAAGGIFPDPQPRHFWINRNGRAEPWSLTGQKPFTAPRFSPNGTSIAWYVSGADKGIWIQDLRRDTWIPLSTGGVSSFPLWTPDGSRVVFAWSKAGPTNVWWRRSDAGDDAQRLTTSDREQLPGSMTRDGKYLALVESNPTTGYDITVVQMTDKQVIPFAASPASEGWPEFSPDGRWLAYASNESGRFEVYVRSFPGSGARMPVSNQGGIAPLWAPDGRELFYWSADYAQLFKVDVTSGQVLSLGPPKVLFELPGAWSSPIRSYDITPDGRRFLVRERTRYTAVEVTQLQFVHNWFEELKRLVPTKIR